jgi:hypothetical protein
MDKDSEEQRGEERSPRLTWAAIILFMLPE